MNFIKYLFDEWSTHLQYNIDKKLFVTIHIIYMSHLFTLICSYFKALNK